MKLLITGGAGFVGARLARTLLKEGTLGGQTIEQLVLADQAAAPADLLADARVQARIGPLLSHCEALRHEAFDGVFHLASAVSGECEADFDLGLRSNLDSTRALLDALRSRTEAGAAPTRLVFSSSVAVYGPDPAVPLPEVVSDSTLPAPQTSYGTHKLICEHLVADYTRKGYIDGRAARLMTVTVRPGRPNGAASSFFSGIIREPLAGQPAILPVSLDVSHPVSSPQRTVDGLIKVYEATREAFVGRTALNLPGLNVTVRQMLAALEAVAGQGARAGCSSSATNASPASSPIGRALPVRPALQRWACCRSTISKTSSGQYIADSAATPGGVGGPAMSRALGALVPRPAAWHAASATVPAAPAPVPFSRSP